ncbi:MAG: phosphatase PAP2 family protein [Bacteroidota bacterium]
MLHHLEQLDIRVTLFLNSLHCPCLDNLMMWCTNGMNWLPLYVLILALLVKYYGKQTIIILLFAALLIAITDQVSSNLFKNVFMRIRPCSDSHINNMIHIVGNYRSGGYSFTSSHATNFFAIGVFLIGLLGKKIKYFTPITLLCVSFIAYTRIYLGVHFAGDVLCGAFAGTLAGFLMQLLFKFSERRFLSRNDFFRSSQM